MPRLTVANNQFSEKINILNACRDEVYYCPFCLKKVKARAIQSDKIKPHFYHIEKSKCAYQYQPKTGSNNKNTILVHLEKELYKYAKKCSLDEDSYNKLDAVITSISKKESIQQVIILIDDIHNVNDAIWLIHTLKRVKCNDYYNLYKDIMVHEILYNYIWRNKHVILNNFAHLYRDLNQKTNKEMATMLGLPREDIFSRWIYGKANIYGRPKHKIIDLINQYSKPAIL